MTDKAADKLIVALDCSDYEKLKQILEQLKGLIKRYKVGMEMYNSLGEQVLHMIEDKGAEVFLDLKYHDIPNTVAQAGLVAARQKVWMYNLHIAGGREMMETAVARTVDYCRQHDQRKPLIIGVTVLTSMNRSLLEELGWQQDIRETVAAWAKLGQDCGLDGAVCSPQEIECIRAACGPDFKIITPGVRPLWAARNDQKRILTPKQAVVLGADYLVVGRPVVAADDRRRAAQLILQEIDQVI